MKRTRKYDEKSRMRGSTLWLVVLSLAMLLAACSTGQQNDDAAGGDESQTEGGSGDAEQGGIPETVQPDEVRDIVFGSMEGKRIAFVPILYEGYRNAQQFGIQMQRTFENMGAEFSVHDSNFDTDLMVQILNDIIDNESADVIIMHNPDLGVLTEQIRAAEEAGIYTVVINMLSNRSGDAYVGIDVIGAGRDLGQTAVEDCESKGVSQVAVIDGPGPDAYSVQFNEGVQQAMEDAGIEIVETLHSNWQTDLVSQHASTLLQRYGDEICAILLPWDVAAIVTAEAIEQSEAQGNLPEDSVGIYTLEASLEGCQALESGRIQAIAAGDVAGVGTGAAIMVQNLLQVGAPAGSRHTAAYVPHTIVTADNMSDVHMACYTGN